MHPKYFTAQRHQIARIYLFTRLTHIRYIASHKRPIATDSTKCISNTAPITRLLQKHKTMACLNKASTENSRCLSHDTITVRPFLLELLLCPPPLNQLHHNKISHKSQYSPGPTDFSCSFPRSTTFEQIRSTDVAPHTQTRPIGSAQIIRPTEVILQINTTLLYRTGLANMLRMLRGCTTTRPAHTAASALG